MTTRFLSFASLRSLAGARRLGYLAGGPSSTFTDRDLDRVASDLLVLAQADGDRLAGSTVQRPVAPAIPLESRRARTPRPTRSATPAHVRAS